MNISLEPPASGQFVMVWWHNVRPWSDVFRWTKHGELEKYQEKDEQDDWITVSDYILAVENAYFIS